jgi:bacterioferritin-associated ferredoxin
MWCTENHRSSRGRLSLGEHVSGIILCLCRDVTDEDVRRAVREGYTEIETLKRFTGAMTGPCQGKTCLDNIRALLAHLTGRDVAEIPVPPCRPPVAPVRLGTLAARDDG